MCSVKLPQQQGSCACYAEIATPVVQPMETATFLRLLLSCILHRCSSAIFTKLTLEITRDDNPLWLKTVTFTPTNSYITTPLQDVQMRVKYKFTGTVEPSASNVVKWSWSVGASGYHRKSFKHRFYTTGLQTIICRVQSTTSQIEGTTFANVQDLPAIPATKAVLLLAVDGPKGIGDPVQISLSIMTSDMVTKVTVTLIIQPEGGGLPASPTVKNNVEVLCFDPTVQALPHSYGDLFNYSKTISNYKSVCLATFFKFFDESGVYEVTVDLNDQGLTGTASNFLCITLNTDCPPPELRIQTGFPHSPWNILADVQVMTFRRSENVHLFADVIRRKCLEMFENGTFDFSWHVFDESSLLTLLSGPMTWSLLQGLKNTSKPILTKADNSYVSDLYLAGNTLAVKNYFVVFSATERPYCGNGSVFSSDVLKLQVLPDVLNPQISGGSYRESSSQAKLTLKATKSVQQVDVQDVRHEWFCHLPEQQASFDRAMLLYRHGNATWNATSNTGCFGTGFQILDKDVIGGITNDSVEVQKGLFIKYGLHILTFVAYRTSTGDWSMHNQTVFVSSVPGVDVSINCESNCGSFLVKNNELRLSSSCDNCAANIHKKLWSVATPVLFNSGLRPFSWREDAATDPSSDFLVLDPNAFRFVGKYTVELQLFDVKNPSKALSKSQYEFSIKGGPVRGICEVAPKSGIELETKFLINCENFVDAHLPITYLIKATFPKPYNIPDAKNDLLGRTVYHGMESVIGDVYLRAGDPNFGDRLKLVIRATNRIGVITETITFVVVRAKTFTNASHIQETYVTGKYAELPFFIKSGRPDNAGQLVTALLSVVNENKGRNDVDVFSISTLLLTELARVEVESPKNSLLVSSCLAQITSLLKNSTLPNSSLLLPVLSYSKAMLSDITNYLNKNSTKISEETTKDVTLACLQSISNLLIIAARQRNFHVQYDLLRLHRKAASTLVKKVAKPDKELLVSSSETLGIHKVVDNYATENSLGLSSSDGAVIVPWVMMSNIRGLVLSTMYYRPFPLGNLSVGATNWSSIPLPVLAYFSTERIDASAAHLSGIIQSDPSSFQNGGQQGYDVLSPLRSSRDAQEDVLSSTSLSRVLLTPFCVSSLRNFGSQSKIVAATATSQCGPVAVHINLAGIFPRTQTRARSSHPPGGKSSARATNGNDKFAFFVLRPRKPCRIPRDPCIGLTFVRKPLGCAAEDAGCRNQYEVVRAFALPAPSVSSSPFFTAEPWAISTNKSFIESLTSINEAGQPEVVILVESLQPVALFDEREDAKEKYQEVSINVIQTNCYTWDYIKEKWESQHCDTGRLVRGGRMHCRCSRPPGEKNDGSQAPLLFAIGLFVLPNTLDFVDMAHFLNRLKNNPYVILNAILWWFIFFPAIIWAKKKDGAERNRFHIVIPPDSDLGDKYLYEVVVFTGVLRTAGTSANVTIVLEGETGHCTGPHVISNERRHLLQPGSIDTFAIAAKEPLGKVVQVHLWHDNSGSHPDWFVERIAVYDLQVQFPPSFFEARTWLSMDLLPFECQVTLRPTKYKRLCGFGSRWRIAFNEDWQEVNVWTALFYRASCSTFTRAQRVGCCATAVFGLMLASVMFYDVSTGTQKISAGYVSLDFSSIIAASQSAVILAPFNYVVNVIYRNISPRRQDEESPASSLETIDQSSTGLRPSERWQFSESPRPSTKILRIRSSEINQIPSPSLKQIFLEATNMPEVDTASESFGCDFQSKCSSFELINEERKVKKPCEENCERNGKNHDATLEQQQISTLTKNVRNSRTKPQQTPLPSCGEDEVLACQRSVTSLLNLPSWLASLTWIVVILFLLACSSLTILYGLQYPNTKFLNWLLAFVLSIVQNIIIVSPIRMIIVATLLATTRRNTVEEAEWTGFRKSWERKEVILRWRRHHNEIKYALEARTKDKSEKEQLLLLETALQERRVSEIESRPWCYRKPKLKSLFKAGKLKLAIFKVRSYWLEATFWVLIVVFVTSLIFLQRDVRVVHLNIHMRQQFTRDLSNIKKTGDIFAFLEKKLLPRLFKETADSYSDSFISLGSVRVKQARLRPRPCPDNTPKFGLRSCRPLDYKVTSLDDFETSDYGLLWKKSSVQTNDSSITVTERVANAWQFKQIESYYTTNFASGGHLRRMFYPSGGYISDLGYSSDDVRQTLDGLKNALWVDGDTSALFVEFALFTPNIRHVTAVTLAIEVVAHGDVNTHYEVISYRPLYFYTMNDIIIAILQLLHILVNVALATDLVMQCNAVRWRFLGVISILTNFWNILCMVIIVLTVWTYYVYFSHIYSSIVVSRAHHEDPGRFSPFATPARFAKEYFELISMVAFFSYIRMLKLFRGSRRVSAIMNTLEQAQADLVGVSVVTLLCLITFGMVGNLFFFSAHRSFKNFWTTFLTLYSLLVGMPVENPTGGVASGSLWSLYYGIFMLVVMVVLLNLYSAVLADVYHDVRQNCIQTDWCPVETLAIAWMCERVLLFFGVVTSLFKDQFIRSQKMACVRATWSEAMLPAVWPVFEPNPTVIAPTDHKQPAYQYCLPLDTLSFWPMQILLSVSIQTENTARVYNDTEMSGRPTRQRNDSCTTSTKED